MPRITRWLGGQGHQWSFWDIWKRKGSIFKCSCAIKHRVFLLFWEEGSLSHFHYFGCNANRCLIKCNSLSLRGSQKWKHLHIKPKNSNMVARMTFSWNCGQVLFSMVQHISVLYAWHKTISLQSFACLFVVCLFPWTRSTYEKTAKINVSLCWELCNVLDVLVDIRWEHLPWTHFILMKVVTLPKGIPVSLPFTHICTAYQGI